MAALEKYNAGPTDTPPAPLRFVVSEGDSDLGLRPGDELLWDADAPKGARVTMRRTLTLHEGDLDRLQLRGQIVPDGMAILAARQRMVARLASDGHERAAA